MTVSQNNSKKLQFRFKTHPGDLFRDTSIQEMPDPFKDQQEFWIWFHPRFQSSQDVFDLNNLYRILEGEYFEDSFREENEWYGYYSNLDEKTLKNEINELGEKITAESFENFYHLVKAGVIEIIS